MRIKLNEPIVWHRFDPKFYKALDIIDKVFIEIEGHEAIMTSGRDGKHMAGSLHYIGRAADFRLPGAFRRRNKEVERFSIMAVSKLRARLGSSFDVVLEKDHIHIELDEKH